MSTPATDSAELQQDLASPWPGTEVSPPDVFLVLPRLPTYPLAGESWALLICDMGVRRVSSGPALSLVCGCFNCLKVNKIGNVVSQPHVVGGLSTGSAQCGGRPPPLPQKVPRLRIPRRLLTTPDAGPRSRASVSVGLQRQVGDFLFSLLLWVML